MIEKSKTSRTYSAFPQLAEAQLTSWHEALYGVELLLLHLSPVYFGVGVIKGDGSAVVLIPGFMQSDAYLFFLYAWLQRTGYKPYYSGITLNADCPNLLIETQLNATIDQVRAESGRRVHLIGHSLGGILARSLAAQRPADVASVITLGSPFRGPVAHSRIVRETDFVRRFVQYRHGSGVTRDCYTCRCVCEFMNALKCDFPPSVAQTAIYSRDDGAVDWRYCLTGQRGVDVEVRGTHTGLAFNANVYSVIAERLARAVRKSKTTLA